MFFTSVQSAGTSSAFCGPSQLRHHNYSLSSGNIKFDNTRVAEDGMPRSVSFPRCRITARPPLLLPDLSNPTGRAVWWQNRRNLLRAMTGGASNDLPDEPVVSKHFEVSVRRGVCRVTRMYRARRMSNRKS